MRYVLGTDVGGTFTDFLLVDESSSDYIVHKTPSTPADPSVGLMEGIDQIAERLGQSRRDLLSEVSLIVHGTTVATNAVLTERGAKTGLLTTEGFRDILEMRRGVRSRRHLYDNKYVAPPPLVSRDRREPVSERVDIDGSLLQPLDEQQLEAAAVRLRERGVEAVAICFMHSYANPVNEQRARELAEKLLPDAFVTCSSEALPQMRLFERVSTSVLNSYVGPVVKRYTENLVTQLAEGSFAGALLVMQSNGGVATSDKVVRLPATILLSGPAAGPVAGLEHVRQRGGDSCIVVDMGGTSFDASLVKDGAVQLTQESEINRQKVALPTTHIHTIGAGGGSIGWLDDGGLLRVGPQSAGADPGPVAYGRGGTEPTVTDADLVLGYLNPDYFLGGRMALTAERAEMAIEERLARPLGIDVVEAASGMYEVVNLAMAAGTKDISVQRGYDPREFALVVAGGAGPVHAASIALELEMSTVVVPRLSPIMCAAGMLLADLRHDFVRNYNASWADLDAVDARQNLDEMAADGLAALSAEGVSPDAQEVLAAADMRYAGQHHEVAVSFSPGDLDSSKGREQILQRFHARHEELYGFSSPDGEVHVLSLRLTCLGRRDKLSLAGLTPGGGSQRAEPKTTRDVYSPSARRVQPTRVFDGDAMRAGQVLQGPAVVEEPTTTVFVPDEFELTLERSGSFVMRRPVG